MAKTPGAWWNTLTPSERRLSGIGQNRTDELGITISRRRDRPSLKR